MTGPRVVAEAVGTFFLVLIGPGAASVNAFTHGTVSHVGVALAFGCVLVAGIYALGHISGAHFNPAVTIGFFVAGRMPGREVGPALATGQWASHWIYWFGPILGAAGAVLLYDYIRQGTAHDHRR